MILTRRTVGVVLCTWAFAIATAIICTASTVQTEDQTGFLTKDVHFQNNRIEDLTNEGFLTKDVHFQNNRIEDLTNEFFNDTGLERKEVISVGDERVRSFVDELYRKMSTRTMTAEEFFRSDASLRVLDRSSNMRTLENQCHRVLPTQQDEWNEMTCEGFNQINAAIKAYIQLVPRENELIHKILTERKLRNGTHVTVAGMLNVNGSMRAIWIHSLLITEEPNSRLGFKIVHGQLTTRALEQAVFPERSSIQDMRQAETARNVVESFYESLSLHRMSSERTKFLTEGAAIDVVQSENGNWTYNKDDAKKFNQRLMTHNSRVYAISGTRRLEGHAMLVSVEGMLIDRTEKHQPKTFVDMLLLVEDRNSQTFKINSIFSVMDTHVEDAFVRMRKDERTPQKVLLTSGHVTGNEEERWSVGAILPTVAGSLSRNVSIEDERARNVVEDFYMSAMSKRFNGVAATKKLFTGNSSIHMLVPDIREDYFAQMHRRETGRTTIDEEAWDAVNFIGIEEVTKMLQQFQNVVRSPRALTYEIVQTRIAGGGIIVNTEVKLMNSMKAFSQEFLLVKDPNALHGLKIRYINVVEGLLEGGSCSTQDGEQHVRTLRGGAGYANEIVNGPMQRISESAYLLEQDQVAHWMDNEKIAREALLKFSQSAVAKNMNFRETYTHNASRTVVSENGDDWMETTFHGRQQIEEGISMFLNDGGRDISMSYKIVRTRNMVRGAVHVILEATVKTTNEQFRGHINILLKKDRNSTHGYKIQHSSWIMGINAGGLRSLPTQEDIHQARINGDV